MRVIRRYQSKNWSICNYEISATSEFQRLRQYEFPIRTGFELEHIHHGLQIDRAIDMGEKFSCKIHAWFPAQFRAQEYRFNHQQYHVMLTGENDVGYADNLVRFGTVDEALP